MAEKTRVRRARVHHLCYGGCNRWILPGDLYLEGKDYPGSELGYATEAGHPIRLAECRKCAERYGRGHRFEEDGRG